MKFNKKIREAKGYTSQYPEVGERLICLRNKKKQGLLNGLQGTVKKFIGEYANSLHYLLEMETGREQEVIMLKAYFDEYNVPGLIKQLRWWDMQKAECFDFAYALTVHKAQGSQWDRVFFWDDGMFQYDPLMRRRWVYTGVTRAAEQIIVAR
jgi:exodeoxyribonuclease-5